MAKSKIFKSQNDILSIIDGIISNADIVSKTFGYDGKDILINRDGNTIITNDGVYVSNHIYFDDNLKDLGSSLIRNITLNSDLSSGDGTTSSAIITKGIVQQLRKVLNKKNLNNLELKNGILAAQKDINEAYKKYCIKIKEDNYYNVSFTSTRNEEISNIITDVFKKIGSKGKVLFKETDAKGITTEYQNGFTFDFGYNTSMLPNVLDNCSIVLFKERLNSVPILQEVIKKALSDKKGNILLIVKDGAADIVMQTAISIQQSKEINVNLNIVRVTGNDKIMERLFKDISVTTGSKIIDNSFNFQEEFFGFAKKITITENQTTLVDSTKSKKEYENHIKNLEKSMIENRSELDKEDIRKRIGNLQGSVAIINIGALSQEKVGNYKDKIKDVVNSLRNAIDEGVVSGGGSTLFTVANEIKNTKVFKEGCSKDYIIGYNIVLKACEEPLKQIFHNSGCNEKRIKKDLKQIKWSNEIKILNEDYCLFGFDAKDKSVVNVFRNGILDPYTTIINSFNNAIEIASMITTLQCAIITETEVFNNGGN